MTIKHVYDVSLFDDEDVAAVICPVNLNGVMGAGLAKEFAVRDPGLHLIYVELIKRQKLYSGTIAPVESNVNRRQKVLLFPTKKNWWEPSPIELVETSLAFLRTHWQTMGISSVGMPMIGCGCGGLPWATVRELIYRYLDDLPLVVHVYGP